MCGQIKVPNTLIGMRFSFVEYMHKMLFILFVVK